MCFAHKHLALAVILGGLIGLLVLGATPACAQASTPSPSDTMLTSTTGQIVDAQGNTWTLVQGAPSDGLQIALNGTVQSQTALLTLLLYHYGTIYQEATSNNFWWAWQGSPPSWLGVSGNPRPGLTLTSTSGQIIDAQGNTWTLVQGAPSDGLQIALNGTVQSQTALLTLLLYYQGTIYQEATSNNFWWAWQGSPASWVAVNGDPRTSETWNPSDTNSAISTSNSNLTALSASNGTYAAIRGVQALPASQIYFEISADVVDNSGLWGIGLSTAAYSLSDWLGHDANGIGWYPSGSVIWNNFATNINIAPYATGDILGVAVDTAASLIWFRVGSGNWNNDASADPSSGTGGISISGMTGALFPTWRGDVAADQATANFGASAFANAAPAGFVSLNAVIAIAGGPTAPPQAVNAGFQQLVFEDEFDNVSATVDLNLTGSASFQWQVNSDSNVSAITQLAPSVMRIATGDAQSNAGIQTWGAGLNLFNFTFGYAEARIRLNGADNDGPGFPAWWMFSKAHDDNGSAHWVERDIMEWFGYPAVTLHDWGAGVPNGGVQSDNNFHPANFDKTQFHLYGQLHQDLGGGNGLVTWWVDNQFAKGIQYGPNIVPFYVDANGNNLGNVGDGAITGTFSIAYTDPVVLVLGSGPNQAMDVDYVRVWVP
jgi:hypothetical protein